MGNFSIKTHLIDNHFQYLHINLDLGLKETSCFHRLISVQNDRTPPQRVTQIIAGSSDKYF